MEKKIDLTNAIGKQLLKFEKPLTNKEFETELEKINSEKNGYEIEQQYTKKRIISEVSQFKQQFMADPNKKTIKNPNIFVRFFRWVVYKWDKYKQYRYEKNRKPLL